MATPSTINAGVGFRHCQVFQLDANGIIYSTGTTGYAGVTVSGAKVLTITDPEPRQIVHIGDDRPFALDVLPPTEPISGELRTAKQNDVVDTLIQGVKTATIGETKLYPIGTDKRGDENQVCLLAYREAVDVDPDSSTFGKRLWQFRLFPRAYVIPREAGFEDNAEERTYAIRPQFATKYPWGITFSTTTEGVSMAQGFRGVGENKPALAAFVTNNTSTSFTLPAAASSTAKIAAFLVTTGGVGAVSTPSTATTSAISYSTAPTTGSLVVLYETA